MSTRLTQESWRRATEWPLTAAAVVFIVAYAWQVLADLHPPDDLLPVTITWTVWGLFVVDYLVRLALADARGSWFLRHLLELLVVVLPALRPLRLLRLISLLTILQRAAGDSLRGRVVTYACGASVLLVVLSALAMLDVERHAPGARITTFSDALWWAVVTITSVGYGDEYPVTGEGRFVAVGMMIAGLALLGTVTATLASLLLDRLSADRAEGQAGTPGPRGEGRADTPGPRAEVASGDRVEPASTSSTTSAPSAASRARSTAASGSSPNLSGRRRP